ncbi:MAG: AAA family ATPase [Rhodobacterales bacterium]|nr:AAA family ATPase [Rhodobacterales bacterium]
MSQLQSVPVSSEDPHVLNLEFVAALEQEMEVRVRRFLAKKTEGDAKLSELDIALQTARERRLTLENALPAQAGWRRLMGAHDLCVFERDVLGYLLCLAECAHINGVLEHAVRRRSDWSSIGRVIELLVDGPVEALKSRGYFSLDSPLFKQQLVNAIQVDREDNLLDSVLRICTDVASSALGDTAVFGHLCPGLNAVRPTETLDDVVLPPGHGALLRTLADQHARYRSHGLSNLGLTYGTGTLVFFQGPAGTGKTLAARAIANASGSPLIVLEHRESDRRFGSNDTQQIAVALSRAHAEGAVLLIDECDRFLTAAQDGTLESPGLLTLFEDARGLVILATNRPAQLAEALDRRVLHRVSFPLPNEQARRRIWRSHVPMALPISDEALDVLAARYPLTGGYIKNAVLEAIRGLECCPGEGASVFDRLDAAARTHARRSAAHYEDISALDHAVVSDELSTTAQVLGVALSDPTMDVLRCSGGVSAPVVVLQGDDVAALLGAARRLAGAAGAEWLVRFDLKELRGEGREIKRMRALGAKSVAAVAVCAGDEVSSAAMWTAISKVRSRSAAVFVLWSGRGALPMGLARSSMAIHQVSAQRDQVAQVVNILDRAGVAHTLDAQLLDDELGERSLGVSEWVLRAVAINRQRGGGPLSTDDLREAARLLGEQGTRRTALFGGGRG